MTPAARVISFLLLGVIVVSLGYLVQHHPATPDAYLFEGEDLPAHDIDRAQAAIGRAQLTGAVRVGNRIKVPNGQKAKYLAAVADDGALPPNYHTLLEKALDLGPFTDGDTRKERLKAAKEQRLSMIVRSMADIEEAQVIYDVREPHGLMRSGKATASVSVRPSLGEPLNPRQAQMIKQAVASAIAGLSLQNVTVTDLNDGATYGDNDVSSLTFETEYYQHKIALERLMQSKIEDLLHHISGVRIQVSATLDDTIERTTRTVQSEGEAAMISSLADETSKFVDGSLPGPSANGPRGNRRDESPRKIVKNLDTKNVISSDFLPGQKHEVVRQAPLVPTAVRVAVAVPQNYVIEIWRERQHASGNNPREEFPENPTRKSIQNGIEEMVKEVVSPLLPKQRVHDSLSMVSVQFFDTLPPKKITGPSMASQGLAWANQHFNTMTIAVIAMVSLMMLRSMIKSIPQPKPTVAFAEPSLAFNAGTDATESDADEQDDPKDEQRLKLHMKKVASLKDDLTSIVQEDPDAAAAILRTWIGSTG
ncbi:MAG: hypothetical protein MK171_09680 [Pirellulales bacterium]|nr:hypothetical protein [Pirellulales bacterium]